MPLKLDPSGLAHTLQDTGYSPIDIIKYKQGQLREERLIKEKREYQTLDKMYDTRMAMDKNDYGVYNAPIRAAYDEAYIKATTQIKEGQDPSETIPNYAKFNKIVGEYNQLQENERLAVVAIDKNPLLTPEQKETAINDRKLAVNYTDGKLNEPSNALKISNEYKIDPSKYVDMESVTKDFIANSQQTLRQDKVTGGVSKTALYDWQIEDDQGNVVVELVDGKNGAKYITEDVFNSWMSSDARKAKIEYEANKIAEKRGTKDLDDIKNIQKELVTAEIIARGDTGSQSIFTANRVYSGDGKTPVNYTTAFNALSAIDTPNASDAVKIPTAYMGGEKGMTGIDITPEVRALDYRVRKAFLATDGKYYVSRAVDKLTGIRDEWIVSADLRSMVWSTDDPAVQSSWDRYSPRKQSSKETKTPPSVKMSNPEDYNGITSKGKKVNYVYTRKDEVVFISVNGVMEKVGDFDDFQKTHGHLLDDATKEEGVLPKM